MELVCEYEAMHSVTLHATGCGMVHSPACPELSCVQSAFSLLPVSHMINGKVWSLS